MEWNYESLHASYNIHGRFVIDEGWQFRSKVTYLFHCIHDGVTFGERIDRDDVEPAFHDFVSPFTLSRFLDLHSPSLFCTFTYVDPRNVARKHAHPFTSKNRFRTAIKLCLSRTPTRRHAILISAIRLWSLVSTKNIYNILNSNDRYVDSWFKNLNKLIHYIYYITYIVSWKGRGEEGRRGEGREGGREVKIGRRAY